MAGYPDTDMARTVAAVYERGVLRPLEPLDLAEQQRVNVTVTDLPPDPADAWIDHEYLALVDAAHEPEPAMEEVRHALSAIRTDLSVDIRVQRDGRGWLWQPTLTPALSRNCITKRLELLW